MSDERPNILLITDDQHRWDLFDNRTVSGLRLPNIGRLRSEGATLINAFSNCPICMPTRFSWCHGLYPSQAAYGLMENWHKWPTHLKAMPAAVRDAGYHTALVGKLHAQGCWGNDLTDEKFVREVRTVRGYDHAFETCGKSFAHRVDCHWTHHLAERGLLDRYREDLIRRVEQLGGDEPSDASFLSVEDSMDAFIGRHARQWLADYDGDRPWFLHASFCGPHFPIDPPAEYHRHSPDDMPDPVGVDDPERSAYWRNRMAAYCGMIEQIDDEVGKLLAVLEQRGELDRTLVIFATDHGDMMGHKDRAHKGTPDDSSARTPFVLRWPGRILDGRTLDAPVGAVDLPATIMAAAGLTGEPGEYLPSTPGRSFLDYIMGRADAPRQYVYSENGKPAGNWRMVRQREWKYVTYGNGDEALYDMRHDPWEMHNLIGDDSLQQRISEMRLQLIHALRESVAPSLHKLGEA